MVNGTHVYFDNIYEIVFYLRDYNFLYTFLSRFFEKAIYMRNKTGYSNFENLEKLF